MGCGLSSPAPPTDRAGTRSFANNYDKDPMMEAAVPRSDEPAPELDRSTWFEIFLSIVTFSGLAYGVWVLQYLSYYFMIVTYALWGIMIFRFHFQIWWHRGFPGLMYLSWRYPHAWIFTAALCIFYNYFKLIEWIVHQCNIFLDDPGRLYKCKGDKLSLHDYAKMGMDLNKPRQFKKGHTYWWPVIYPNIVSPHIVVNVYVIGPYAGFGSLPIVYSDHHVTFHNDVLGTHPGYNNHVTLFFTDEGVGYWHVAASVLPPFTQLYKMLWEWYCTCMWQIIEESKTRTHSHPTVTFAGSGLYYPQYDPPKLHEVWKSRSDEAEGECEVHPHIPHYV